MTAAARSGDGTNHPGIVVGTTGTVLIGGVPAATVGDPHVCAFPGPIVHPPSTIASGSTTVFVAGRPAARSGDITGCGAVIISGAANVLIGG